jgi:hypothetical protein
MNNPILLKWSDEQSAVQLSNVQELDRWLDDYSETCSAELPAIVTIYVHGYEIGIGVGLKESFVHVEHETGEGPYLITVGDDQMDGVATFFLHSSHHTEIPNRHLVPMLEARKAVREFCISGERIPSLQWEEV